MSDSYFGAGTKVQKPQAKKPTSLENDLAAGLASVQDRSSFQGISVKPWEYDLIAANMAQSKDPEDQGYRWANAIQYSRIFGKPLEETFQNLEAYNLAYLGEAVAPKSAFKALVDSWELGQVTQNMNRAANSYMLSGGTDAEAFKEYQNLKKQSYELSDNVEDRSLIIEGLKNGMMSVPYMIETAIPGALAVGAGLALAGASGGSLSGLALAALFKAGSFFGSASGVSGLEYMRMRENGVDHDTAAPLAVLSGALQGGIEVALGADAALASLMGKGALKSISAKVAQKIVTKGLWPTIAARTVTRMGGQMLEEGVEEGLQQAVSAVADWTSAEVMDSKGVQVDRDSFQKVLGDIMENAKMGALAAPFFGAALAPFQVRGDYKALKQASEFAKTVDRETFKKVAGSDQKIQEALSLVPDDQRAQALDAMWTNSQAQARKEDAAQAPERPINRLGGALYTQESTLHARPDGSMDAILKAGDPKTGERYGYLRYEIKPTKEGGQEILLKEANLKPGVKSTGTEMVLELAARYPGVPIVTSDISTEKAKILTEKLAQANPRGLDAGAQWFGSSESSSGKARLRAAMVDAMPNLSSSQAEVGIALHEARANAMGLSMDEYVSQHFQDGIFSTDEVALQRQFRAQQAAAEPEGGGNPGLARAGIGFDKDAKAIIYVTKHSNFKSFVHESGHAFRRQTDGTDLGKKINALYGVTAGVWTTPKEEEFTEDLMRFLSYGEVRHEGLRGIFEQIGKWLVNLWESIKGREKVSPELQEAFNELFASEKSPVSQMRREAQTQESGRGEAQSSSGVSTDEKSTEGAAAGQGQGQEAEQKEEPRAPGTAFDLNKIPVVEVPVDQIQLSADVPQFKEGANEKTGAVEPIQAARYERLGTAPIVVWERKRGQLEVITGRHRLDLARRLGEYSIPAQVVREADGFSKEQAATFDAEANIRDGQGSVRDYVNYFRFSDLTREGASSRGLLSRDKGRTGFAIGRYASNGNLSLYLSGQIGEKKAAAIAEAAPNDEGLQALGIKKARALSAEELFSYVSLLKSTLSGTEATQLDMFGTDDSLFVEAEKVAKEATSVLESMTGEQAALKGALRLGKGDRAAILEQYGVKAGDEGAIRERLAALESDIQAWEQWTTDPAKVRELRVRLGLPVKEVQEEAQAPVQDEGSPLLFEPDSSNPNLKRSRRDEITFEEPFTGTTGAKLLGYAWPNIKIEEIDHRGESFIHKYSDWSQADISEMTGRKFVHKFIILRTDGSRVTLSAESAAYALGVSESTARAKARRLLEKEIERAQKVTKAEAFVVELEKGPWYSTPAQAREEGAFGGSMAEKGRTWGERARQYLATYGENRSNDYARESSWNFIKSHEGFQYGSLTSQYGVDRATMEASAKERGWEEVNLLNSEVWDDQGKPISYSLPAAPPPRPAIAQVAPAAPVKVDEKGQGLLFEGEKIISAAVRVSGEDFTGPNHGEAMAKALEAGALIKGEDGYYYDRDGNDLFGTPWADYFLTSKGRFLTRLQADKQFNVNASENMDRQTPFLFERDDLFLEATLSDAAVRAFGTTTDPAEAGYILPDGRMLDFSGKNQLGKGTTAEVKGGTRRLAHEAIGNVAGVAKKNSMIDFMAKTGAVRVDFERGAAYSIGVPSFTAAARIASYARGSFTLHIDDSDGNLVGRKNLREASPQAIAAFYDSPTKPDAVGLFSDEELGPRVKDGQGLLFEAAPPVKSEAFREWFGDSKVVDADGNPAVQYHGTLNGGSIEGRMDTAFTEFRTNSELGAHFGTAAQAASRLPSGVIPIGGERIYPVYLSIKNPIRLTDYGQFSARELVPQLIDLGLFTKDGGNEVLRHLIGGTWEGEQLATEKCKEILRQAGYDGVVYLNRREGADFFSVAGMLAGDINDMTDEEVRKNFPDAADSWIAFEPTQIKSVFNQGAWSKNNPNLLFEIDEETVRRLEAMERIKVELASMPDGAIPKKWIRERLRGIGSVVNLDSGRLISITGTAADKVGSHSANQDVLAVVDGMPEIIARALFIRPESQDSGNLNLIRVNHYGAFISLDGSERFITITTRIFKGREYLDQLYNWQSSGYEKAAGGRESEPGAAAQGVDHSTHPNRLVRLIREVKPDFLFKNDDDLLFEGEPSIEPGMVRLYRGETNDPTAQAVIPDWMKNDRKVSETLEATGRWFSASPELARYYVDTFGFKDNRVTYVDIPEVDIEKYRASNQEAGSFSAPGLASEEFFLPKEVAAARRPLNGTFLFERELDKWSEQRYTEVHGKEADGQLELIPDSQSEMGLRPDGGTRGLDGGTEYEPGRDWWYFRNLEHKGITSIIGARIPGWKLGRKYGPLTDAVVNRLYSVIEGYRDRRYETFRYLFIDKNGKIIDHAAVSMQHPNIAMITPSDTTQTLWMDFIKETAITLDASVILVHNHPSGSVEPSSEDIAVTDKLDSFFGDRMAGHIILDHGKVAATTRNERGAYIFNTVTINKNVGKTDPTINPAPMPTIGLKQLGRRGDLVNLSEAAEYLESDGAHIPFFFLNNRMLLSAVRYVPRATWENETSLKEYLLASQVATGSIYAIPVIEYSHDDYEIAKRLGLARTIADFLLISKNGKRASGFESGLASGGSIIHNRLLFRSKRIGEDQGLLFESVEDASSTVQDELFARDLDYSVQFSRSSSSRYIRFDLGDRLYTVRVSDHHAPPTAARWGQADFFIDTRKPGALESFRSWISTLAGDRRFEGQALFSGGRQGEEAPAFLAEDEEVPAGGGEQDAFLANRGKFTDYMAAPGELENFLASLGDAIKRDYDPELTEGQPKSALEKRLASHPFVYAAVNAIQAGKNLVPSVRRAVLGAIRHNELPFKELYGEVMRNPDVMHEARAERKAVAGPQDIKNPKLRGYEEMSVGQRMAVLNKIRDAKVREKIENDEITDAEIMEYIGRLEASREKLKEKEKQLERGREKNTGLYDALRSAREEAAKQTRQAVAEIRAMYRIREARERYLKAILEPPAKRMVYAYKAKIRTIQKYLKAKKWETEPTERGGYRKTGRVIDPITIRLDFYKVFNETAGIKEILDQNIVNKINELPVSAWSVADLKALYEAVEALRKQGRFEFDMKESQRKKVEKMKREDIARAVRRLKGYSSPFATGSDEEKDLVKKLGEKNATQLTTNDMDRIASYLFDRGTKDKPNWNLLIGEERDHYRAKMLNVERRTKLVYQYMKEQGMKAKDLYRKVTVQGAGPEGSQATFTVSDLMMAMIALRNDDSRKAFIYGNLFSEAERRNNHPDILKQMAPERLKAIQDAINTELSQSERGLAEVISSDFNKEFDRLNQAMIDLTEEDLEKVDNYVPIRRQGEYFEKFSDEIMDDLFARNGISPKASPNKGMTKRRIRIGVEHQMPMKLDLFGSYLDAVDKQEHLIEYGAYHRKVVAVYASKLSSEVREAIKHTYGKQAIDYLDAYIAEIANPIQYKDRDYSERLVRKFRGTMAVGYLGFRWVSVVNQLITSPLPYIAYAPGHLAVTAAQAIVNPKRFIEEVEAKSVMLRHRTIDPAYEQIKHLERKGYEGIIKAIGEVGMKGLTWADRYSVAIGWKAVYDKALETMDEEAAIREADNVTLKCQPSARGVDQSPLFRDNNEWKRILTTFGSQLNVVWQQVTADLPEAAKDGRWGEAVGIIVATVMAGLAMGVFRQLRGKDAPEDENSFWREYLYYALSQGFDSVPLAGSMISAGAKRIITGDKKSFSSDDTLPVVGGIVSGVEGLAGGKLSGLKDLAEAIALQAGLPVLAVEEYLGWVFTTLDSKE
jgi:hypothetical protein